MTLLSFLFAILTGFIIFGDRLFSQTEEEVFRKEIDAGKFRLRLECGNDGFFTGNLRIMDETGSSVFSADSFYTRYNSDTIVDLNNDGSKELILDLGTGATMYDYNMFLIFDFSAKPIQPLEVHNAEFSFSIAQPTKILSYSRLSPAVMGAGYIYSLKYEDGKLLLENNMDESDALKSLDSDGNDDLYLINEYANGFDECADDSQVSTYYQAYIMQQKILGQEEKGWSFFEKNYKCKNKKRVRNDLKKIIDETYAYINNPANYKFMTEKY